MSGITGLDDTIRIDSLDIQGSGGGPNTGILIDQITSTPPTLNIVYISNCNIHDFTNGIDIKENYVEIFNCDFSSNTHGVFIQYDSSGGGTDNQIISCNFNNNGDGIELISTTSSPYDNKIIDCVFDNNNNGVHLNDASTNTIDYCYFTGNDENGVLIEGSSLVNTIKKCNFENNDKRGISIGSDGNNNNDIYYSNFNENGEENAFDGSSNTWDDGVGRGNIWDDYEGIDTDWDGIGDDGAYVVGGANDQYPIAAYGRYIASLPDYSIDYWNPSGESIILTRVDLDPYEDKIVYLYYGGSNASTNGDPEDIAVETAGFKRYQGADGVFARGEYDHLDYKIPMPAAPGDPASGKVENKVAYVVEARLKIESEVSPNQVSMILLNQFGGLVPPVPHYDEAYLASIHTDSASNNKLYLHKTTAFSPPVPLTTDAVDLTKSLDNWLLLKSSVFITRRKDMASDLTTITSTDAVRINTSLHDFTTLAKFGSIAHGEVQINLIGDPHIEDGWVGIGCGLLVDDPPGQGLNIADGKITVDWIRIRKAPWEQPIVTLGPMESLNCFWHTGSSGTKHDYKEFGDPFFPGPVLRDYNQGGCFKIEESLDPGTYTVTITMGDIVDPCEKTTVTVASDDDEIVSLDFSGTEPMEFETRSATFDWSGGDDLQFRFGGYVDGGSGGDIQVIPGYGVSEAGKVNAITLARGRKGVRISYE